MLETRCPSLRQHTTYGAKGSSYSKIKASRLLNNFCTRISSSLTGDISEMKPRPLSFESKPLEIVEIDLEGPKGEVLVEIKATGICHTDEFTLSGADPRHLSAVLGHEGAGIVVDVGSNVKSVKKGDHVIPLYTPECQTCNFCLNPKTNLC